MLPRSSGRMSGNLPGAQRLDAFTPAMGMEYAIRNRIIASDAVDTDSLAATTSDTLLLIARILMG